MAERPLKWTGEWGFNSGAKGLSMLLACDYSNCKCYDKVCLRGLQVEIILGKGLQN